VVTVQLARVAVFDGPTLLLAALVSAGCLSRPSRRLELARTGLRHGGPRSASVTLRALLATGIAAVVAPTVRAGPPFVTDDPEPVEYRHWEVFLASQLNHDPGGWSGTSPHLEVNYGAARDLQASLTAAVAFDAPKDGQPTWGYGDTELAMKYRFVQEANRFPQVAVFPRLELPSGDRARGLGAGHVQAFLPVWLQKSWGSDDRAWTTYGGGGYWINPGSGNRNWWFVGEVLQRRVTDRLTLGAEVFHETAQESDDEGDTGLNAGGIFDFDQTYHLLLSAGHTVQGPSGFQAYVAFQIRLETPVRDVSAEHLF